MDKGNDELQSLRRSIRDLVAFTALPAIWLGRQPHDIAESLSDVLLTRLSLDLVYIRFKNLPGELELIRTTQQILMDEQAQEAGKIFVPLLNAESAYQALSIDHPLSDGSLLVMVIPIGYEGSSGFVVAGTETGNLNELDRLLLSVATNEAVTALQQAHLLANLSKANQTKDSLLAKEQATRAEMQQTAERITLLQELTSKLSQASTVEEVTQVILRMGNKLFNSDCAAIYTLSEDKQILYRVYQFILDDCPAQIPQIATSISTPVTDALRTRKIVWIEDLPEFIDRYPHLSDSIADTRAVAVVPFLISDQIASCLELNFKTPRKVTDDEIKLLTAVAQQCVQALERAYLTKQAEISAALEERQRLARDLHDAVSQVLFAATLRAEAAERVWDRNPQRARAQLGQAVMLNRAAMGEMRTLLLELRPEAISGSSLTQLINYLIEAAKGRREVNAHLVLEGVESPLPPEVHVALYRIAQECITNILKHSQAQEFRVCLSYDPNQVILQVIDSGTGFDVQHTLHGRGLGTMRARAEIIDADFQITSVIGQGTDVKVSCQR